MRVGPVSRGGFSPADDRRESGGGRGPCSNAGSRTVCERCPRVDPRGGGGAGRSGPFLLGDLNPRDAGRFVMIADESAAPTTLPIISGKLLIYERYQRRGFGTANARPDRRELPEPGRRLDVDERRARRGQPGHVLRAIRLQTNRRLPWQTRSCSAGDLLADTAIDGSTA
jgi:hypothetical protein